MTTAVPTRHPDAPQRVPAGVHALAARLGVRPAGPAEFRRLGEGLTVGDPPADALAEWMTGEGRSGGRELFERALAEGIDAVADAPAPLADFFTRAEATPDWVDWEVIEHGTQVMRRGGADGLYVARDTALQAGYLFAGFNQTLLRTGALEKGSNQRFAETTQWALDCIRPGELHRGGAGYRSTLRVRLIHGFVRRHVSAMADWDADTWGLPVNQTDMAATILGSFIVPVTAVMTLGVFNTPGRLDAVTHVTRYIGWLLGVEDDLLPGDFTDAVRLLHHTLSALSRPDETSKQLAAPMAEDPLSWNYPNLRWLRRRVARSQHLSILRATVGRRSMESLGLPGDVLPWYPAVRFPINAVSSAMTLLPGGLERAAERGYAAQEAFLATMTSTPAEVGASAAQDSHAH